MPPNGMKSTLVKKDMLATPGHVPARTNIVNNISDAKIAPAGKATFGLDHHVSGMTGA